MCDVDIQHIHMFSFSFLVCRVPADIVFAVDASGSIGIKNFELETAFLRVFIIYILSFVENGCAYFYYIEE